MQKDTEKSLVVFREFKDGQVLAIFPELEHNWNEGLCVSYMHVGQHGGASYSHCISITRPAHDYSKLQKELENLGYNLDVKKKYTRR